MIVAKVAMGVTQLGYNPAGSRLYFVDRGGSTGFVRLPSGRKTFLRRANRNWNGTRLVHAGDDEIVFYCHPELISFSADENAHEEIILNGEQAWEFLHVAAANRIVAL